jgi:TonB family protein
MKPGRSWLSAEAAVPVPPTPGAPRSAQNIDSAIHRGRGEGSRAIEVVYLAERVDVVNLSDTPMTTLDESQLQRIDTARDRSTEEDRRATPSPSDAVFLASGRVGHEERRAPSASDPRSGTPTTRAASVGAAEAETSTRAEGVRREPAPIGGAIDEAARGILRGRGERESRASRVAYDRPPLDRAHAATPSDVRDAHVRDDVDSELLTARMIQSFVDASRQRGLGTSGAGGVGGRERGAGGDGFPGGSARPYAPGAGDDGALYTGDSRYTSWVRDQRRRIQDGLEFPRARQLAMDQGLSVHRVRVRRDGTLAASPRLVRSTGFTDLDDAARRAIEAALPFAPLPDDLAPELATLSVDLTIEFVNPMVR